MRKGLLSRLYRTSLVLIALYLGSTPLRAENNVTVVLETTHGPITVEVFLDKAPLSAGSFLAFLDAGRLNGGGFYRVVRPDNDNGNPLISVIQGGVLTDGDAGSSDQIAHETTAETGLKHLDGTLSLARSDPGTASGGVFFICVGDQPALDFGGLRNPDKQGFAAFGRVISGMPVVRQINALSDTLAVDDPYVKNQILTEPVRITLAYRQQPLGR